MTGSLAFTLLEEFFAAENARDWPVYAQYLHPDVEWIVVQGDEPRIVQGAAAYLETIREAYDGSPMTFRCVQTISSEDDTRVGTLLVDESGHRSLEVFEFQDGLIRREWEYLLGTGGDWNGDVVEFRSGIASGGKE